jgi:hypothetical protein
MSIADKIRSFQKQNETQVVTIKNKKYWTNIQQLNQILVKHLQDNYIKVHYFNKWKTYTLNSKRIKREHQILYELHKQLEIENEKKSKIDAVTKIACWYRFHKSQYIIRQRLACHAVAQQINSYWEAQKEKRRQNAAKIILKKWRTYKFIHNLNFNHTQTKAKHNAVITIQKYWRTYVKNRYSSMMVSNLLDNDPYTCSPVYLLSRDNMIIYDVGYGKTSLYKMCNLTEHVRDITRFDFLTLPKHIFSHRNMLESEINRAIEMLTKYVGHLTCKVHSMKNIDTHRHSTIDDYKISPYRQSIYDMLNNQIASINTILSDARAICYQRNNKDKIFHSMKHKVDTMFKNINDTISLDGRIKKHIVDGNVTRFHQSDLVRFHNYDYLVTIDKMFTDWQTEKQKYERLLEKYKSTQSQTITYETIQPSAPPLPTLHTGIYPSLLI